MVLLREDSEYVSCPIKNHAQQQIKVNNIFEINLALVCVIQALPFPWVDETGITLKWLRTWLFLSASQSLWY
jgi:hypothetical protein